ncbi:HNH endonuclease [Haloarchaeobius sp. FL176]|uniref:HNH endonuclease n=1 Tax=Haloarchaeobius sp. FL176 TaxID=2967129 RepID=UPI002147FA23
MSAHSGARAIPDAAQHVCDRFWEKVDVRGEDECWEWKRGTFRAGYGAFHLNGAKHAHRIAYRMENGPIPGDMQINHACGNRACVNPNHLYAGTQAENAKDTVKHGQHKHALAHDTVRAIRNRYEQEDVTQGELADEFGTGQSVISRIVRGEAYDYIE